MMHRVEYTAHPELGKIDQRLRRNAMDQAALKNKRQVKTDQIVAHQLVRLTIKVFQEFEKRQQGFFLVLLNAVVVYAKHMFAVRQLNAEVNSRNWSGMHGDGKYAPGSSAQ